MGFLEIKELPVQVTTVTVHKRGQANGMTITMDCVAREGELLIDPRPSRKNMQANLWGDQDELTPMAHILNGSVWEMSDLKHEAAFCTSNGDPLLRVPFDRMQIRKARTRLGRLIDWTFNITSYNSDGDLDGAQALLTRHNIHLNTGPYAGAYPPEGLGDEDI